MDVLKFVNLKFFELKLGLSLRTLIKKEGYKIVAKKSKTAKRSVVKKTKKKVRSSKVKKPTGRKKTKKSKSGKKKAAKTVKKRK